MLRIGDSKDVEDVNSFFENEVGIFNVLAPTGEDMIVMCPPGRSWFVQKSTYRPEADGTDKLWRVTKLASWARSAKSGA